MDKNRIEEVLVSNSSPVSGLSEASGVKFSWGEVSQESQKTNLEKVGPDMKTYGKSGETHEQVFKNCTCFGCRILVLAVLFVTKY